MSGSGGSPRGAGFWRREVRAETVIQASAEHVWELLTDLDAYRSWNRFMPSVSGELVPGARVRAEVRFRRGFFGIPLRFRAQVLRCDSCREIRWTGRLLFRWLFSGVHSFVLDPAPALPAPEAGGPGADRPSVLLVHREVLSGLLLPVLGWYLAPLMEEGFREMNEALRVRAESRTGS